VLPVSLVAMSLALLGVVEIVLVLPLAALRSANSFSKAAWNGIGRSKTRWSVAFFIVPLGIGSVAAILYFAWLHRKLLPYGRVDRIGDATRMRIVSGPHAGQVGTTLRPRGPFRLVFGLTGYVWFRLGDTGQRFAVSRDLAGTGLHFLRAGGRRPAENANSPTPVGH
jgi:hypothetical protein